MRLPLLITLLAPSLAGATPSAACERVLAQLTGTFVENRNYLDAHAEALGRGACAHVYRVVHADGTTTSLKLYDGALQAALDQRALDFYRRIATNEDEVRIAETEVVRPNVMLVGDIRGRDLRRFTRERRPNDPAVREVLRRYAKFNDRFHRKLRRLFGRHGEYYRHHDARPPHRSAYVRLNDGAMMLIPHARNVIVEDDTHALWLVDPR